MGRLEIRGPRFPITESSLPGIALGGLMFKVGDIAIYVRPGSLHYGEEVVIASPPRTYFVGIDLLGQTTGEEQVGHIVKTPFNGSWGAKTEWLRKKDEGARDWFNKNIKVKVDEVSRVPERV